MCLRLEASMWVRENANKKGSANMTAASFCAWVNEELVPSATLPPSYPRFIGLRTATRWLHRLGFRPMSHKKGAYVDGHECADVVAYRDVYLKKLDDVRSVHRLRHRAAMKGLPHHLPMLKQERSSS